MSTGDKLRLVIVTPERTLLDETASALRFPLYDGDIGILPGRLPLIGRLGVGELKVTSSTEKKSYFIDGGFVQVLGGTISLLTQRAVPTESLVIVDIEKQLEAAQAIVARTDEEIAAKLAEVDRARRMLHVAKSL